MRIGSGFAYRWSFHIGGIFAGDHRHGVIDIRLKYSHERETGMESDLDVIQYGYGKLKFILACMRTFANLYAALGLQGAGCLPEPFNLGEIDQPV